ncbi:dTDP-4-dehydrorhamnose 3,5-epimerase [Diaphorobacter sp. HDW4A]|uniref:cupin domain-containing protein n=1 Tax=Diaphorobacter sp. HDW4A TaxID=2714924 RepID=UPI00140A883B|nr:dTDP-4-dehydrorhamnose 3,5-epimerase family protein [Diaphorobacter sp. HDW4A]QIL81312.1 dTDP-4-dehydrorhamnose 3,5-epimerase [Diaphorobacter sp. HDW4A]
MNNQTPRPSTAPEVGEWQFSGTKDVQTTCADWSLASVGNIQGVELKLITNVLTDDGTLTEIYRKDWRLDDLPVEQIFQKIMSPGSISAWHAHRQATDRLFCGYGRVKVILYDARKHSPTLGLLSIHRLAIERPSLLIVPPGVWHGVQAVSDSPAIVINAVDIAYSYEDPDHWRLPSNSAEIPYQFKHRA